MQCTEIRDKGAYCAWVFNEDNSLGCALENNPDLCDQFATQAECEARIDGDPRQPRQACLWASVSTFNVGNDACEPVQVKEKCVLAALHGSDATQESQCGDASVHWQDLGAGTVTLTELQRCGYAPFHTTPCDFGNSTLPVLCDCACGGS